MFDSVFSGVGDGELVAAIEDGARQEAIAAGRRLAAIAELIRRRVDDDDARALWACDPWDSAAAEVAAAMGIGARRASAQMRIAQALAERLPRVASLLAAGRVSVRVVSAITWGTRLVEDPAAVALIDTALAERAAAWERLAEDKLRDAVGVWVARYDPDARRRCRTAVRGRDVTIGCCDDDAETTSVWGRLRAADAAALKARMAAMTAAVCPGDPRSSGERRSDALGAVAHGHTTLACACGSPSCPAADTTAPASPIVIHVLADQTALTDATTALARETSQSDAGDKTAVVDNSGETAAADKPASEIDAVDTTAGGSSGENTAGVDDVGGSDAAAKATAATEWATRPATKPVRPGAPALLLGRGVLPHSLLADAIRAGATIRPIGTPGAEPEPHYRPSDALAEFVRMRDLYCRFPGCTVTAEHCDLDHARPWPHGPTHPSNLNCKCRGHHLLKTFWTGPGGWSDVQLPDGTVIWTAPSGQTYTTHPGSRLYFPTWNTTTAALPPTTNPTPPPHTDRTLKMPRRHQTRTAQHTAAIKAERALNQHQPPPPF
jgi:hypothetical protein